MEGYSLGYALGIVIIIGISYFFGRLIQAGSEHNKIEKLEKANGHLESKNDRLEAENEVMRKSNKILSEEILDLEDKLKEKDKKIENLEYRLKNKDKKIAITVEEIEKELGHKIEIVKDLDN